MFDVFLRPFRSELALRFRSQWVLNDSGYRLEWAFYPILLRNLYEWTVKVKFAFCLVWGFINNTLLNWVRIHFVFRLVWMQPNLKYRNTAVMASFQLHLVLIVKVILTVPTSSSMNEPMNGLFSCLCLFLNCSTQILIFNVVLIDYLSDVFEWSKFQGRSLHRRETLWGNVLKVGDSVRNFRLVKNLGLLFTCHECKATCVSCSLWNF